jgi:hypothetical protein
MTPSDARAALARKGFTVVDYATSLQLSQARRSLVQLVSWDSWAVWYVKIVCYECEYLPDKNLQGIQDWQYIGNVCVYIYIQFCLNIYIYIYMHRRVCVYVYIYIYLCTCDIYMCVCFVYVCTTMYVNNHQEVDRIWTCQRICNEKMKILLAI